MKNFELWTNPFDDNLRLFESQLESHDIKFETEYCDGDESTCFYAGVVYTFLSREDFSVANEIYDNI